MHCHNDSTFLQTPGYSSRSAKARARHDQEPRAVPHNSRADCIFPDNRHPYESVTTVISSLTLKDYYCTGTPMQFVKDIRPGQELSGESLSDRVGNARLKCFGDELGFLDVGKPLRVISEALSESLLLWLAPVLSLLMYCAES